MNLLWFIGSTDYFDNCLQPSSKQPMALAPFLKYKQWEITDTIVLVVNLCCSVKQTLAEISVCILT